MEAITLIREALEYIAPPPPLTCSEWADKYRNVATGPFPGRWSTARTPDLQEIMDCVTDPMVEEIVIMKPTRVGATEGVINNAIGYFIHYDPCQILYVQTSLDEGRKYSNEILVPMIDTTPVLAERVAKDKSDVGRKATQTKMHKTFPGGNLAIVGAKSPKGFRMVSKRVVICDDIDGYESNKEGDVVSLATGRAKDYWNRKKILVSNPTTEGVSRIHNAFLTTDQRYRYTPCPHCGEFQVLKFGGKDHDYGLKWTDANSEVWYLCEHCHQRIYEYQKHDMNLKGEWRSTATGVPGKAGYHINPFLRAWHPWADFRKEFTGCKGDPLKLMVFVNQWLGEVWKEDPESKVDENILYARREAYPAEVPMGALLLTAAVDVQDNRIEVELKGWGPGEECWGIDHKIISGRFIDEKVQHALDEYLLRAWRHESGEMMSPVRSAIDSGGHYTSQVYAFCKARETRGVYAIKGSNVQKADVLDGTIVRRKDAIYQMVGVTACKDILYGRVRLEERAAVRKDGLSLGPGYMHWPMSYDKEYFKQLFGEKCVTTKHGREWRVVPGVRNEAIDLHNYNLAALRLYSPDWDELRQRGVGAVDQTRLAFKHHRREHNQDENIAVQQHLPLILCCDFKQNPLIWELVQTDKRQVWVVDEVVLRNATTMDACLEVLRRYGNHREGFIVYGTATGTTQGATGRSEYAIMRDMGFIRQVVKPTNPLLIDCVNATNNMLEDITGGHKLKYHPRCLQLRKDFEQALWQEDMQAIDTTDFGRGNASGALGNYLYYEFPLKLYRPTGQTHWK